MFLSPFRLLRLLHISPGVTLRIPALCAKELLPRFLEFSQRNIYFHFTEEVQCVFCEVKNYVLQSLTRVILVAVPIIRFLSVGFSSLTIGFKYQHVPVQY
jgi:hypothetical protein